MKGRERGRDRNRGREREREREREKGSKRENAHPAIRLTFICQGNADLTSQCHLNSFLVCRLTDSTFPPLFISSP